MQFQSSFLKDAQNQNVPAFMANSNIIQLHFSIQVAAHCCFYWHYMSCF